MDGQVGALVVSGSDLYAGGNFTTAGGTAANAIAKWNGSSWSALGSGIAGSVLALAVSGGDLYAGGNFAWAGDMAANYIAKWNGSSWSPLGSGVCCGPVTALAVSGSNLYVGGGFTTAGDTNANLIARWNGSSWSAVGAGMDGPDPMFQSYYVFALAVSGSDLYAGGSFTTADASAAMRIAKWNGSNWSGLGSGMGGGRYTSVSALAVLGSDLYVGGNFLAAGGKVSPNFAKAIVYPLQFEAASLIMSNRLFQALLTGPTAASVILDSTSTFTNWTPIATNTLPFSGWPLSLPAGGGARQFYRARFAN